MTVYVVLQNRFQIIAGTGFDLERWPAKGLRERYKGRVQRIKKDETQRKKGGDNRMAKYCRARKHVQRVF